MVGAGAAGVREASLLEERPPLRFDRFFSSPRGFLDEICLRSDALTRILTTTLVRDFLTTDTSWFGVLIRSDLAEWGLAGSS